MQNNAAQKSSNNNLPQALANWQQQGQQAFVALPTTRDERWKYTSLKALEAYSQEPRIAATVKPQPLPLVFDHAGQITLVNGVYDVTRSTLPKGMRALSLLDAAQQYPDLFKDAPFNAQQPLAALNSSYAEQGVVVWVEAKAKIDQPIIVQHVTTPGATAMPRIMLFAGAHSECTFVDLCHGAGAYWVNAVYEVHVDTNARLHHYRWQNETMEAAHITTTNLYVGRDASYDSFVLTTGAQLARQDITAHLVGENAECRLNGVYLAADKQLADTTIVIHHEQPHGRSNQTFKGIVDDEARAVFQGKVHVHQIAQKTDGYQLNNALLLSKTAEVNVKPELEIYADDVKCSHGATTGQLDTGPLFYLRTRGLSEAQAKFLLMQAFLGPAIDEIRDETVRQIFADIASAWLAKHTGE